MGTASDPSSSATMVPVGSGLGASPGWSVLSRHWRLGFVYMLICALFGCLSMLLGPDNNWDLRYYHLYAPYAYMHHRYRYDVGPAQYGSYFNPIADFLFYGLISSPLNHAPRVVAFIMGTVHGVNAALVLAIARHVIRPTGCTARSALVAAAWAIGVTGAGFISLLGTTTNDLIASIPVLASLLVALRLFERRHKCATAAETAWDFVGPGLLLGLAIGLKYTSAIYVPGLSLLAAWAAWERRTVLGLTVFIAAAAAGFVLLAGHHMATLWSDFGNPFFPLFNQVFRSPWWEPMSIRDDRFVASGPWRLLLFPFSWAHLQSYVVAEPTFRDARAALAYGTVAAAMLCWIFDRVRHEGARRPTQVELIGFGPLIAFLAVSFTCWALIFGIYRYGVAMEMLTGVAVVSALIRVIPPGQWRLAAVTAVLLGALASTVYPDWGRLPYADRYVSVEVPTLAPHSVVLIATWNPAAFFIPFAEPTARYVGINNNYLDLSQHNLLTAEVDRVMREKGHDKFILSVGPFDAAALDMIAGHFGLALAQSPCLPVRTNLEGYDLALCRLLEKLGDLRN
jgi:hypothetical protein